MLTRAAPVASAARSDSSSRMPPDSSTLHVEAADHVGEQRGVGAPAEGGVEVDQVDPVGAVALPGQRRLQRVAVRGLASRPRPGPGGRPGRRPRPRRAAGSASSVHTLPIEGHDDEHRQRQQRPAARARSAAATTRRSTRSSQQQAERDARRWRPARPGCAGRAARPRRRCRGVSRRSSAPPAGPARAPAAPPLGLRRPPAAGLPLGPPPGPFLAHARSARRRRRWSRRTANGGEPVAQQRRAGVAGLLRVELGRRQAARLDRGHERPAVDGRGHQRAGRVQRVGRVRRVRVDEVEPRVGGQPGEQRASRPAARTVFQPMCGTRSGASSRVTPPGSSPGPW